ncbi:MAG: radical SAM protein [Acidobacteriota bacterium]|nr:radical SAM protein [Acidobacteriota bacterium]
MQQLINLTGIARLAAEGSLLSEKKRVEYRSLPTRKWLNRCDSRRVPFHWTINPYRGCEYGCKYCYARFTHEFLERSELDAFETEIYAKDWNEKEFRRELSSVKAGQVIGLGTATDPYQPAERRFHSTRKVLEALMGVQGLSLFVTTKSDLVSRDADLLKELGQKNDVRVTSTVTTMDRDLARLIEPFGPRPDLRMEAVSELAGAGVQVGVIASPVLPLITDSIANLETVARAAKAAGADQFGAHVLFLKPSAQRVFFPFVAEKFPQHFARYGRSYASGAYLTGRYPEFIRERVDGIRSRVGLLKRDFSSIGFTPTGSQLVLF